VRLIRQLLDNLHSFLEESEASLPHPSTNHGTGTDGAVSIHVAERVQQEVLNCDMKILSVACQWFHCQTCAAKDKGAKKKKQVRFEDFQLVTDAILGLDFLVDYKAVINFAGRSITLKINGENTKIEFTGIKETTNAVEGSSSENQFHSFGLVPSFP